MPSRKRTRREVEVEEAAPPVVEYTLLDRIRSTSEFAALLQFLHIFGKSLKLPEISIEDFEQECLLPTPSSRIADMGLALLKHISSHRGLTPDLFDEYTRRQYVAKAPQRNPFGIEEIAASFDDFDIFTKIRVLHQLTLWTFFNPDKMRDRFADLHFDYQAADWRINPYGWDAEGRTYFLLDDDRLYRQTDPPVPEPARKKTKALAKGNRLLHKRRLSRVVESTPELTEDEATNTTEIEVDHNDIAYEENFADRKWECVAISYDDFQNLITSIKKSRDPDERTLCKRLENDMMPLLQKKEEERQKQELRRQKELATLQMLAGAKRSSRIANKVEQQQQHEQEQEVERKRLADLRMAQKEAEKQQQLEQDRESRMQTREQRLREREVKRILHEEELRKEEEKLAQLAKEEAEGGPAGRVAHRQLMADMEKRQKEIQALQAEEDQWVFDCSVCGVHGHNVDDGTHSIACDKCGVWQHSACHGIGQEQAERSDFTFVCKQCKQRAERPVAAVKAEVAEIVKPEAAPIANGTTPQADTTPIKIPKKRGRPPKDPSKLSATPKRRSNMKIIKKKDPSKPGSSPSQVKSQLPSSASSMVNGFQKHNPLASLGPVPPLIYPGPPPSAPNNTNGFIQYQPQAAAAKALSLAANAMSPQKPAQAHPHMQNDTSINHVNSSPPEAIPSTPSQNSTTAGTQPQKILQPAPQPQYITHAPSSQGQPRTPSFAQSMSNALSSPAQYFSGHSPANHAPDLGASQSSMHGSSPGYSPRKHPSPPRPVSGTHHFTTKDNPIKPPVALSPVSRPVITSPPVKRSSPVPSHSQPSSFSISNVNGTNGITDGDQQQHQAEHVPAPAVVMQNEQS